MLIQPKTRDRFNDKYSKPLMVRFTITEVRAVYYEFRHYRVSARPT